jgi:hypothetical protein
MDNYSIVIKDGAVKRVRTIEEGVTPLADFLKNLQEQTPTIVQTPPLPLNCVRYVKTPFKGEFHEIFCVYSQPGIHTVAWRPRENHDQKPKNYTVSWPGLIFKFIFNSAGIMLDPRIMVCNTRPTRTQERLYLPSLPNVFDDGRICITIHSRELRKIM